MTSATRCRHCWPRPVEAIGLDLVAGPRQPQPARRSRPAARQDRRRRPGRRPQRLAHRPAGGRRRPAPRCAGLADARRGVARPARCCTSRSTSPPRPTSTRSCARGWRSPGRRWTRSSRSAGRCATAPRGLPGRRCRAARRPGAHDDVRAAPGARCAATDRRRGDYAERADGAAGTARAAAAADHHDRLVPADRRAARRPAPRSRAGDARRRRLRRARCAPRSQQVIALQEELGLDVLVHGEPERNDMVQYFAEQLDGFAATAHGWVQSYGSRCVRPPILYGDVARPAPMTVALGRLRPVADRPAGQGHAHRPGHDPGLVVRPRRPAAGATPPTRSRSRCATRSPTWRRPASGSSRSTSPRCGSCCRCAGPSSRRTWTGPSTPSGWPPPASPTPPRSTPTCATRSSARSSPRSTPSTPT